ncbi:AAA family ATPase [uncultured Duncaniella sp.]|mgnify:FL=1|uniref:AAA family ATPase n=1 Tax=uncultured Duncaniella sp. TaxID=2768039 RepID=UPI002711D974|nr:AAA family ATPase [uncultured Duncaniella sp.]
MIYIQRVRSNDIGEDYGKQVELGKVFMSHHNWETGEISVVLTFRALSESQMNLNGTKIKTSFKVRGDERGGDRIGVDCKEYANQDRICVLKQFLTEKLHLNPGEDYFILEDVGNDGRSFNLYGVHSSEIPATVLLDKFKGQVVDMDEPQETETAKNAQPLQVIYYGAPGTGKSFTIDDMTDDKNSVRTTFHPDSDYASFVGAYKPTMEDVPISATYQTKEGSYGEYLTKTEKHPGTERKIVYKYVPQAFLKAYVAAWSNLDTPYFLIIEEINRGNCAQIFGDLFQLLDRNNAGSSSYAIHADEDITQFLSSDSKGFASLSDEQKDAIRAFELHKDNGKTQAVGQDILNGELLLLPPNLYIWATMNTSDQSLFPIDSAFKRRWNWKYMPIEYHPIDKKTQQPIDWNFQIGDNIYSWGQFLSKINPEIYTLTESSDKQMGYFFAKADNTTGIISEEVFLNKVLFYLWTDVFKDFDVSSELFKNKKANRSFRFTDFFEDPEALGNFIDNFNLDVVEDLEHVGEIQNEKGEWVQPTFMVDGEKISSMIDTVLTVLKKYFEKYPDISTEEAIQVWNSFGLPKHALETEQVFAERTDMSKKLFKIRIEKML